MVVQPFVFSSSAPSSPSWSFYYSNVLLMQGSADAGDPGTRELTIRNESKELLVTFTYAGTPPEKCTLHVVKENQIIRSFEYEAPQAVDAFTPTVGTGAHYVIGINEIIDAPEQGKQYAVDFHYSDHQGIVDLQIGTIVFNF